MMTSRERFRAILKNEFSDGPFLWESGFDDAAVARWHEEGLPEDANPFEHLGLDRFAQVGISTAPVPELKDTIIQENEKCSVIRDEAGGVRRVLKDRSAAASTRISATTVLEWTLRDRGSWELIKSRMDPFSTEREAGLKAFFNSERPADDGRWSRISGFWGSYDEKDGCPVAVTMTGPTYWTVINAGFENTAILMIDDPGLISDIFGHYSWFIINIAKKILGKRAPDIVIINDEPCYKGGLFMSPEMYEKYAAPVLGKIAAVFREAGTEFIFGASEGKVRPAIPIWKAAGLNGAMPLDVSGGTDPVSVREEHKELYIIGGMDRTALEDGRDRIRREIETTADVFYREGRAIPSGDCHFAVSGKVSFDSIRFYIDGLREAWSRFSK